MHKLVLDTNTYVSGFLWEGNEAKLIREIGNVKAPCFINKEILEEIDDVLRRGKFIEVLRIADTTADEVISKIVSLSTMVIGPKLKEKVVKGDKKDDKFIECAINAKAEIIVSGDEHLLKIKEYKGIKIITTSEALKILGTN